MINFVFIELRWLDVIDIVLVALFLSYFYTLVRGTVAMRILVGLLVVLIIWKITIALQMELLSDLIGTFIGVGSIAFVIIFQPELRKFLIRIGSSQLVFDPRERGWFNFKREETENKEFIETLLDTIKELSLAKIGAIIVLDNGSDIEKIADTGTRLDAKVSKELILTIFFKNNILHDGAVIINQDRIVAAGCILPNSDRSDLPSNFGLRHRAVIGLGETSNAFSILVSEESGKIMYAFRNQFQRNVSLAKLREQLEKVV
jgi:uncharacterized protein (TIGR00159 family)